MFITYNSQLKFTRGRPAAVFVPSVLCLYTAVSDSGLYTAMSDLGLYTAMSDLGLYTAVSDLGLYTAVSDLVPHCMV